MTDGSVIGYKYFDFRKTHDRRNLRLEVNLVPKGQDALVEVWAVRPSAAEGGVRVGSFALSANFPERPRREIVDVSPLAARNGREALYFTFRSDRKEQSLCEIEDFRFAAD